MWKDFSIINFDTNLKMKISAPVKIPAIAEISTQGTIVCLNYNLFIADRLYYSGCDLSRINRCRA